MGMHQTCCLKQCTNETNQYGSSSEVKIIANQAVSQKNFQLTNENQTLKTTLKGTMKDHCESSPEMMDENQSSNLENNPIPPFIKYKEMHSSVIPERTNRFIMDLELEVRAKIKEIQQQEQNEVEWQVRKLNQGKVILQSLTVQDNHSNLNIEPLSNLQQLHSSSLQIEKLQSTQLECISAPVNNQKRGILKSISSLRYISSNGSKSRKSSTKRVHFSNETKFKTEDLQTFNKWRRLRNY